METKPGYLTTEFWLSVLNTILQALVLFGVLNEEGSAQAAELIVPLIMAVVPIAVYIWSRTRIKTAALMAGR